MNPADVNDPAALDAAVLLLVDEEEHSASVLAANLHQRGFTQTHVVRQVSALAGEVRERRPVAVILNFHYHRPESLAACGEVKAAGPDVTVIAMASAGPAIRMVRQKAKESQTIDVVVEKPLSDERFFLVLREVVEARLAARQLQQAANKMESLLPAGAVASMRRKGTKAGDDAELFQAAVLFTDIRRSTEFITRYSPEDFFRLLNDSLSAQSREIALFEGAVVKYTGDGVFAIFRGMGRSYLALRCALELSRSRAQEILPFGIGVAEGLVMSGFVGDSYQRGARRQYDVLGATVNLAARLCSIAKPAEVIATTELHRRARLSGFTSQAIGDVAIRGFSTPVQCVAYAPAPALAPAPVDPATVATALATNKSTEP